VPLKYINNQANPAKMKPTEIIRLIIHPARIKRLFDFNTVNSHITNEIKSLDEKFGIKQYQLAKKRFNLEQAKKKDENGKVVKGEDGKPIMVKLTAEDKAKYKEIIDKAPKDVEQKLARYLAYTKAKYRISESSTYVLAYVCEKIAQDLISHAISVCYDIEGKKQVTPVHFFKGDYEKLLTYPLIRNLPTWIDYLNKLKSDPELKLLLPKRKRAEKKEGGAVEEEGAKKEKKAQAPKPPLQERLFTSYVSIIAKNITKPPKCEENGKLKGRIVTVNDKGDSQSEIERDLTGKYSVIRISEQAKALVNKLLYDFLAGLSNQIIVDLNLNKTKTVNTSLVNKLIESQMVFDCHFSESFAEKTVKIKVPSEEALELQASEKARRKAKVDAIKADASLTAEEKEAKVTELTTRLKKSLKEKLKALPSEEVSKLVVDRKYTFNSPKYSLVSKIGDIASAKSSKSDKYEIVLGMPIKEAEKDCRRVSFEEYQEEKSKIKALSAAANKPKPAGEKKKAAKPAAPKKKPDIDLKPHAKPVKKAQATAPAATKKAAPKAATTAAAPAKK